MANNLSLKLKTNQRDVLDIAAYRCVRSYEVAERLEAAASESPAALGCVARLCMCASSDNVWIARDLNNDEGEKFDGAGSLWKCNEVLCPSCLKDRRRRLRKRIRVAVAHVKASRSENWRLLTLTAPVQSGVGVVEIVGVFNRAFSLLRKRKWWIGKIRAGVKGLEFTLSEGGGYHVHLHLLALSGWVSWLELGEEWTVCIKKALLEAGLSDEIPTSHGRAVVDVRLVTSTNKSKSRSVISEVGAVEEVCKYLTKIESWLKIPDSELVAVAEVPRWARMVEVLGDCRGNAERDAKRPCADDLQGGNVQVEAGASIPAYLDTKDLNDGCSSPSPPGLTTKIRPPTLRDLALSEPIGIWLPILLHRVEKAQRFRKQSLAMMYPSATFTTLDGKSF